MTNRICRGCGCNLDLEAWLADGVCSQECRTRWQSLPDNAALINALVKQKDQVIILINRGEDDLVKAKTMLDLLHPVWVACGYGYKGRELYRSLREKASKELADLQDYLSKCRKNCSTRGVTMKEIKEREEIILEC